MKNISSVFWISGLSGSGKSTIALESKIWFSKKGYKVLILDGDKIRNNYKIKLSYSREDVKNNNLFAAEICKNAMDDFDLIIAPIISPYESDRKAIKNIIRYNFHLIYCKASIKDLYKRDTKGLYYKERIGEIDDLIGISKNSPYEEPQSPELIINTSINNKEESVKKFIDYVRLNIGV